MLTGFTAGAGICIAVNQFPTVLRIDKAGLVSDLWCWVLTRLFAWTARHAQSPMVFFRVRPIGTPRWGPRSSYRANSGTRAHSNIMSR